MAFADVAAITARFRDLTPDETTRAAALLGDAELALRAQFPTLPQNPTGQLADALAAVSAQMVIRVLRNPGGYRSEQAGEFSYTRERGTASGELEITDADRALVEAMLAGGLSMSDAFTIVPTQ